MRHARLFSLVNYLTQSNHSVDDSQTTFLVQVTVNFVNEGTGLFEMYLSTVVTTSSAFLTQHRSVHRLSTWTNMAAFGTAVNITPSLPVTVALYLAMSRVALSIVVGCYTHFSYCSGNIVVHNVRFLSTRATNVSIPYLVSPSGSSLL
jgi:hypothetical protein